MADVLRQDHSPVTALAAVLRAHHRDKVLAGALPDHRRATALAAVLRGHRRVKVRVAVLQDSQAAVGALRDHHPVMAAVEEMVAVTAAAVDKAVAVAAVVETTSSSSTDNCDLSPVAGSGTDLRLQQHASDARIIKGLASLAPAPHARKIHLPDQAPVFAGAWSIDKKTIPVQRGIEEHSSQDPCCKPMLQRDMPAVRLSPPRWPSSCSGREAFR